MKPFTIWIKPIALMRIPVENLVVIVHKATLPGDAGWAGVQQRERFYSRGLRWRSPDFQGKNEPYLPT